MSKIQQLVFDRMDRKYASMKAESAKHFGPMPVTPYKLAVFKPESEQEIKQREEDVRNGLLPF